jgi:hypothetical protein
MTAFPCWASQIFCYLVHMNVAVIDFDEKLHGAWKPYMRTAQASGFDKHGIIQVS